MGTKISALPSAGTLAVANEFPVSQSGTTNKVTWANILTDVTAALNAIVIDSGSYTASPAGIHAITMSDTTGMIVGYPIRITQDGTTRYQIITAVVTNTSVATAGAPMQIGVSITELSVGRSSETIQMDLFAPGQYASGGTTNALLLRTTKNKLLWLFSNAYLVQAFVSHNTADGGAAEPQVNIRIDGADVFSEDSGDGAQLPTDTSSIELKEAAVANYNISRGDEIELSLTVAGTNEAAKDLSVTAVFVLV